MNARPKPRVSLSGFVTKSTALNQELIKNFNILNSRSILLIKPTPLFKLLNLERDWDVLLIQFSSHFFPRSNRFLSHDGHQSLDI